MTLLPCLSKSSSSLDTSSKEGLSDPEKSSSLFLFILSLAVLYGSVKLGMGTLGSPGPGFLPFWAAIVLSISSILHFLLNVFSKTQKSKGSIWKNLWEGKKWWKVIYILFALGIYTVFLNDIGFILCTFFLIWFLLTVIQIRRWYIPLIEGALITLAIYIVFEKLLAIGFPKGIFKF